MRAGDRGGGSALAAKWDPAKRDRGAKTSDAGCNSILYISVRGKSFVSCCDFSLSHFS